ncbi:MAG: hypothetical protein HZB17_02455 [Chloroflexi bacterium]|nr:hypothetical protein [Chloroflexota bacterium]
MTLTIGDTAPDFELPSDAGKQIKLSEWGEKSFMGKKYMSVIRSHFIVDEHGTLIDVQYDIKPDASVAQALEKI